MSALRAALLGLALLAQPAVAQERLVLPSGLEAELVELLWDEDLETGRFRLVAPALADPALDPEALADDFMALCTEFALPVQRALRPGWRELVISLASEPRPFGQSDPTIAQFFAGFLIEGRDCIWSDF